MNMLRKQPSSRCAASLSAKQSRTSERPVVFYALVGATLDHTLI
jgi:hypothetical protein